MPYGLRKFLDLGLDPLLVGDPVAGAGPAPAKGMTKELNGVAAAGLGAAALQQEDFFHRLVLALSVLGAVLGALWLLERWRARKQRIHLECAAWIFLSLGIFFRQNLDLQTLRWTFVRFELGMFFLTVILALATYPWAMRTYLKNFPRMRSISLNLIAVPFSAGFFLDLARLGAIRLLPGF